ncbi:phosphatase PAP2 family protein [Kitasatospora purpeofusca]|uniref:phosphatase PAP2 family protein n=1 Tax=Kitasatospora purpeofusca TaxID=67352 RepID=UPI002251B2BD|nr:phosphatase PAP2 family protein [Kitasatospora purpeofusca]MCX4690093.1 phosphatase PAP2 family protein [Kitasatospora purpeofusca]
MNVRPSTAVGAVLALCVAVFATVAALVAAHGWAPFGFERGALDWVVAHRPHPAERAAELLTDLGTGVFSYLFALAAGFLAARATRPHRSRPTAVAVLLAPVAWLAAGQLLRQGLMHGFGRPRPPAADWAFTAHDFAFPSGHAFTAALSAGLLTLAATLARPGAARPAATAAAVFALLIGCTRVYLGVHWPLDVLAGWLLAVAWLALGVLLFRKRLGALRGDRAPG